MTSTCKSHDPTYVPNGYSLLPPLTPKGASKDLCTAVHLVAENKSLPCILTSSLGSRLNLKA